MSLKWCQQPENGLPKPDVVFLLTLSQDEMIQRPGFGEERYECPEIQKKVANLFEKLCDEEDNWVKINAAVNIDEVHQNILKICLEKITNDMPPLQKLKFDT